MGSLVRNGIGVIEIVVGNYELSKSDGRDHMSNSKKFDQGTLVRTLEISIKNLRRRLFRWSIWPSKGVDGQYGLRNARRKYILFI
jgi:hypothetical protein